MKLKMQNEKKPNKISRALLTVTPILALLVGCGTNQTNTSTNTAALGEQVKVGYVNILSMAPVLVGKEKGLFDQQGLKA